MGNKTLTNKVISEWDVARRTAEFFDGALANLRTFGLTASVTLFGVAFEFNVPPLFVATTLLNIALIFIDNRYQDYLVVTARYAMNIENEYKFASSGLSHAIHAERSRQGFSRPENIFRFVYVILAIGGIVGFVLTLPISSAGN